MKELLRTTGAYRAIAALARAGELPHTLLVVFPDETYLRVLLRECAKAVCGAEDGSRVAALIDGESYADCLFFPDAGGKLTVDDAARIIDESLLLPLEGGKKVFVADAFHTASAAVQNKLLKVLEEPPEGTYFLIGAAESYAVLPTVVSRAAVFSEPPFAEEEIYRALVRSGRTEGAREAAAACGGVYSLAEELLAGGGEFIRAERLVLGKNVEALCRELGDDKKADKRAFFAAVRLLLRDALLFSEGGGRYAAKKDVAKEVSRRYPAGALLAALALTDEAERNVKFNANFGQAAFSLALGMEKERKKWQALS